MAEVPTGSVTLGDLIREGKLLWTYCIDCGRERDLDPKQISLPPDTTVPGLGRRHLRCSACGSRKVDTRPELYPGGVAAQRSRDGKGRQQCDPA